ncbi:unnamed protein product [Plutella xylostella]|uniref:(diamondback moth) hypothetical protein n=1 Tax=Plutella xylostella TaxID=51655 RepID=A0A8S4FYC2_PLUXY|nr:unnamed protein product [Plutella xylostella]
MDKKIDVLIKLTTQPSSHSSTPKNKFLTPLSSNRSIRSKRNILANVSNHHELEQQGHGNVAPKGRELDEEKATDKHNVIIQGTDKLDDERRAVEPPGPVGGPTQEQEQFFFTRCEINEDKPTNNEDVITHRGTDKITNEEDTIESPGPLSDPTQKQNKEKGKTGSNIEDDSAAKALKKIHILGDHTGLGLAQKLIDSRKLNWNNNYAISGFCKPEATSVDILNCDKGFNIFHDILTRAFDDLCPKIKIKAGHAKCDRGWITPGIKKSCESKRELFIRVKTTKDDDLKKKYNTFCRVLNKVIAFAKRDYNEKKIVNADDKIKSMWNLINENTKGKKIVETNNYIGLSDGKKKATTNYDAPDIFNDFFSSIGSHITGKPTTNGNCAENNFLPPAGINTMFLHPVSMDELSKTVNSLKNKKSSGYDDIPTSVIKTLGASNRLNEKFKYDLEVPASRTVTYSRTTKMAAIKVFNSLPDEIKSLTGTKFFTKLKEFLIVMCPYSLNEFYDFKPAA